ncbi:MAG: hypothetical protein IJO59_05135 [Clostridia bacterium]|nr:hypothetical protein [Clostridia bacterium]
MSLFRALLGHLTRILAMVLIVLLIVDYFNPYMEFLSNTAAKIFLLLLCVSAFLLTLIIRKK